MYDLIDEVLLLLETSYQERDWDGVLLAIQRLSEAPPPDDADDDLLGDEE